MNAGEGGVIKMTTECEKVREMLFDFIENEECDDFFEIKKHLEECPSCQSELDECKKLISAVGACAPSPERDIKANVMLAVSADAKRRRRSAYIKRISCVAAAVVICIGIGIAVKIAGMFSQTDSLAPGGQAPVQNASDKNDCAADFDDNGCENGDVSAADTFFAELGNAYGYENVCLIVLDGTDAARAFELLREQTPVCAESEDFILADAEQTDAILSRLNEIGVEHEVTWDEFSNSDAPEIVAVCIK